MEQNLAGKVAVVTGGGAGIGRETARELWARGARVAVLDRDGKAAESVASELSGRTLAMGVDVVDRVGLEAAVAHTVDELGGIDIVISNAGIAGPAGPMLSVDQDEFEEVLHINLLGACRTIRACLPHVVERQGYVLAVSSMVAALPTPTMAAYGMSKAGVDALGRALRIEMQHHGVDVGVAYFGLVSTNLIGDLGGEGGMSGVMSALPGPMSRPISARRAALGIADGVCRRSSHVYAPGWVRALMGVRGQMTMTDRLIPRVPAFATALTGGDDRG